MTDPVQPALTSRARAGWPRRVAWPALITLVAGGIWLWSERLGDRCEREIRAVVEQLVVDVAAGRDQAAATWFDQPAIEAAAIEALRAAIPPGQGGVGRLRVDVVRGDHPQFGNGSASHHAILAVDGRPILGLRLMHANDESAARVIGMWRP
jgi:hypothetical protein